MLTILKTYVTSFFSTNANLHEILEVKKCDRRGWMLTQQRRFRRILFSVSDRGFVRHKVPYNLFFKCYKDTRKKMYSSERF